MGSSTSLMLLNLFSAAKQLLNMSSPFKQSKNSVLITQNGNGMIFLKGLVKLGVLRNFEDLMKF